MLPHRQQFLGAVDECGAGSEGNITVSRRHDGHQGCVAYGKVAHAVGNGQGNEVVLRGDGISDLL